MHKGHIEITSDMKEGNNPLTPFDVHVKLDGKTIPLLQRVELDINVDGMVVVKLTLLPRSLAVRLSDIEVQTLQEEE